MRRGLMGWDAQELPLGTLEARIGRLQASMQKNGLQAMLIYTNLVRPSAVSYLTGFTPYWSEGILLVGRTGPPVFATALSKRVASWIRSVSPVGEIVNAPRPGTIHCGWSRSARRTSESLRTFSSRGKWSGT